jgi:hypothetical protein
MRRSFKSQVSSSELLPCPSETEWLHPLLVKGLIRLQAAPALRRDETNWVFCHYNIENTIGRGR